MSRRLPAQSSCGALSPPSRNAAPAVLLADVIDLVDAFLTEAENLRDESVAVGSR